MASIYKYEDFLKAAQDAGLYDTFSTADLNLARNNPEAGMSILSYKQDYANAKTDEARALANTGAERIRSQYGNYTGGGDGSQYYAGAPTPGSFTYDAAPAYENRYTQQADQKLSDILNRPQFSYDAATDPLYSQYRKEYTREGQRATQDAMGAAAAMSGGLPSSYAVTAANQAGNYYASQMTDKIPELYQMAYNKYLNDYNMQLSDLSAIQSAEQNEYNKYLNALNQYNTDRNFAYGQYIDEVNDQTAERQETLNRALTAYEVGDNSFLNDMGINTAVNPTRLSQALQAAQYLGDYAPAGSLGYDTSNNPMEWERQMQERQLNASDRELQLRIAQLAAQYGDYSMLRNMGINPDLGVLAGSSGGGGGGRRYSSGSGGEYSSDGSALLSLLASAGSPGAMTPEEQAVQARSGNQGYATDANFSSLYNQVKNHMENGRYNAAQSLANQADERLTSAQAAELNRLINSYSR